jgi:hypothetical protein
MVAGGNPIPVRICWCTSFENLRSARTGQQGAGKVRAVGRAIPYITNFIQKSIEQTQTDVMLFGTPARMEGNPPNMEATDTSKPVAGEEVPAAIQPRRAWTMHGSSNGFRQVLQPSPNRRARRLAASKKKKYRRHDRRFHGTLRAAVLRAFTAADLLREGRVPSLREAAACCGSNIQYVQAAVVLRNSENISLMDDVFIGTVPLLAAARSCRQLAKLVEAYRKTTLADHIAFGKQIGPGVLWDEAIVPAIS